MTSQSVPVLIGDIGGTNSRLSLIIINDPMSPDVKITEINKINVKTFNYPTLKHLLSEYVNKFKDTPYFPDIAVLGIPGALINNKVIISNALPYLNGTTGSQMANDIGIKHLIYLNDFNINGYSIQSTKLEEGKDYFQLNPGVIPEPNSTKAMIGAGTGLGMGYLTKSSTTRYYSVHSSEGGQQDFSPTNPLQQRYKEYLIHRLNVFNPTIGHACSGSAISYIYSFFKNVEKEEGDVSMMEEYEQIKSNQDKLVMFHEKIIQKGINNECSLCKKVVNFFVELYGSVAGNLAISMLPFGGLYLLGGVSAALAEYIKSNDIFMKHFSSKGGLKCVLEKFPIYIMINQQIGVFGAAVFAKKFIEEEYLNLLSSNNIKLCN
jgi:glucokinase